MQIAVLSDIHANALALEAVTGVVAGLQPDAIWCLGDVVGYGPEPQACLDYVRGVADLCIAGNHDLAVAGYLAVDQFSADARTAVIWQQRRLDEGALAWLRELPERHIEFEVTLVHGSPRAPIWEYVTSAGIAVSNAPHFSTPLCLIGHSHMALAWRLSERHGGAALHDVEANALRKTPGEPLALQGPARWLLNPGSVGQPRDGDPRASFALLDTAAMSWTWHRVQYDIPAAAAAIRAAGLPSRLAERLYGGW